MRLNNKICDLVRQYADLQVRVNHTAFKLRSFAYTLYCKYTSSRLIPFLNIGYLYNMSTTKQNNQMRLNTRTSTRSHGINMLPIALVPLRDQDKYHRRHHIIHVYMHVMLTGYRQIPHVVLYMHILVCRNLHVVC